jgi:hypothetical protein
VANHGRFALHRQTTAGVPQTSQSAVSRVSQPADRPLTGRARLLNGLPIGKSAIPQVGKPAAHTGQKPKVQALSEHDRRVALPARTEDSEARPWSGRASRSGGAAGRRPFWKVVTGLSPCGHCAVAAGILPAVEPWRPARRKNRATLQHAGYFERRSNFRTRVRAARCRPLRQARRPRPQTRHPYHQPLQNAPLVGLAGVWHLNVP